MKTIELKLLGFDELEEDIQDRLIKEKRESLYRDLCNWGYDWESEGKGSLDAFCKIFPIEWKEYDIDRGDIDFKITCDDEIKLLSGRRLQTYIWNNYRRDIYKGKYYSTPGQWTDGKYHYRFRHSKIILDMGMNCALTGYCADDDLLKPIYEFMDSQEPTNDFEDLLSDCLQSWVFGQRSEMEYAHSEERAKEELSEMGEVFTEDGEEVNL